MAAYDKLEQFRAGDEDWEFYEEHSQYFVANDIKEAEKQRAIFLSVCVGKYVQGDMKPCGTKEARRM